MKVTVRSPGYALWKLVERTGGKKETKREREVFVFGSIMLSS